MMNKFLISIFCQYYSTPLPGPGTGARYKKVTTRYQVGWRNVNPVHPNLLRDILLVNILRTYITLLVNFQELDFCGIQSTNKCTVIDFL